MRKFIVITWLSVILCCICALFWSNEIKYTLPTPVPKDYVNVRPGQHIDLNGKFSFNDNKPVFIHFFNPDCPCSRFNIKHFKALVKSYGSKMDFAIVVINKDNDRTEKEIQEQFGLTTPVSFDASIATLCGVYSTPQAVILDAGHKLYFRGNYNKSRYCTDKNSNYAQMAADSLLTNMPSPTFSAYALKAYGCQLANCTKPQE